MYQDRVVGYSVGHSPHQLLVREIKGEPTISQANDSALKH